MINNKRYTLNDAIKAYRSNAIKACNNLINKAEKIAELRSTKPRQKMLKIFNYLGEVFNGQQQKEKD